MATETAKAVRQAIVDRTRQAREATGMSQEDIAILLGIGQGTYKNYETNRPMPHEHVARFCIATRVDIAWLFTGSVPTIRKVTPRQPPRAVESRKKARAAS